MRSDCVEIGLVANKIRLVSDAIGFVCDVIRFA